MSDQPVTPPPQVEQKKAGMQGQILVTFNTATGETSVSAGMDTQEMKNLSISVLLTAINIILTYQKSAIIRPGVSTNGKIIPRLPN